MCYTSVKKILVDNDTNEIMKYKELVPMFHMMEEAAEGDFYNGFIIYNKYTVHLSPF